MARVYGLTPNFAGDSVLSCQQFQENVNQIRNAVNHVRKTVNLFSKLPVNHIRKNTKNCQPKSGKDNQEKYKKLSTKIRKRHISGFFIKF